ncbi:MAG: ATP-binding protein [Desulfobacteraceae bacterium]
MKSNLKYKINLAILVTFASIAVIFTAIEFPFQQKRFRSSMDKIELVLKTLVERDREPLANEIFDKNLRAMKIRLKAMMKIEGMRAIQVFDSHGSLLVHDGISPASRKSTLDSDTKNSSYPLVRKKACQGKTSLFYSEKIEVIGEPMGFITLCYSLEEIKNEQLLSHVIFGSLMGSILLIMLVVLNITLTRTIITPITFLRDAMERVRKKGINQQVKIESDDEIGDLAKTFNRMILELEHVHGELKTRNSELKTIIDSMPSVLVGVDSNKSISHWNRAAEKFTGISRKEAKNRLLREFLSRTGHPANTLDQAMDVIDQAITRQTIHTRSRIPATINRETRYLDLTIFPLDGKDLQGAVIRIDDVTDHVKMEETMVQSEKMMSVGGLAAGMAHEINNPLAGILQNASVIKNRLSARDLPANQRDAKDAGTDMTAIFSFMERRDIFKLLGNVQEAGMRAAEIVKDMLGFARKGDESVSSYSMEKLLDEAVNLAGTDYDLKKKFDFKQIEIVREYGANLPTILCEKSKIQQVFFNILQNGAQAMAEKLKEPDRGGARFILRTKKTDRIVQVEIEDNGPGMDPKESKRIFEPFFTTKPVDIGTGLGLSIAYFIIHDNHKGSLAVETRPGKGANFIIRLPIIRGEITEN